MNWKRWLSSVALLAVMLMGLPIAVQAADYGFTTTAPQDFYKSGLSRKEWCQEHQVPLSTLG